jgi:hypothetical protein
MQPPAFIQAQRIYRFYDCCAAERERAPSPQKRIALIFLTNATALGRCFALERPF